MDFSETIVVYDLKLATDDRSDETFLLTSNLCPLGDCMLLPWGYIYVLNHVHPPGHMASVDMIFTNGINLNGGGAYLFTLCIFGNVKYKSVLNSYGFFFNMCMHQISTLMSQWLVRMV